MKDLEKGFINPFIFSIHMIYRAVIKLAEYTIRINEYLARKILEQQKEIFELAAQINGSEPIKELDQLKTTPQGIEYKITDKQQNL